MSATSSISPSDRNRYACFSPKPSMSIAPFETKCFTAWNSWPGHDARFGQIVQTPSSGLIVGVPHAGQRSGAAGTGERFLRRWAFALGHERLEVRVRLPARRDLEAGALEPLELRGVRREFEPVGRAEAVRPHR